MSKELEKALELPEGWLIELGFDVLDRPFRFVDSKSHLPTIKVVLPACEVDESSAWDLRDSVASLIGKLLASQQAEHPEQAEGALRCTCPSGNGSLQWPCPEHSGGAQGEREAFEAYRDRRNAQLESEGHKPGSKWHVTHAHYATWEAARAALAQPSPAPELERPEVVAWALQRKRDGFVRATWHQKPSETQYEIAELDGDVIAPLYAAPSVSTWKAPEGFALVPIEPTVAMRMPWKTMRGYSWHSKYKAMLAAAAVQRGEL